MFILSIELTDISMFKFFSDVMQVFSRVICCIFMIILNKVAGRRGDLAGLEQVERQGYWAAATANVTL
jgi:hypothetical protein